MIYCLLICHIPIAFSDEGVCRIDNHLFSYTVYHTLSGGATSSVPDFIMIPAINGRPLHYDKITVAAYFVSIQCNNDAAHKKETARRYGKMNLKNF